MEMSFAEELGDKKLIATHDLTLERKVRDLVAQQSFCILCTQGYTQPYGSLIAYVPDDDLKTFLFATPKTTRKYELLSANSRVAIVIDDRSLHQGSPAEISAVTVTGSAEEIASDAEYATGIQRLKIRHPYLAGFLDSTSPALFNIHVVRYFYVAQFQAIAAWIP
ncbi:MAG: pyridoxamine 5'-phosphate oxidase family protein [Candidatus Zhuqueibacterota bacterium]